MLLTPLIRRQLVIFTVLGLGALLFTGVAYGRIPQRLGLGVDHVRVEFADASGLYASAIVTYRGVKVGEVSDLDLSPSHAVATLSIDDDARVPRSAVAEIRSTSAIGEQYVDLVPSSGKGPFLHDGDTIGVRQTRAMPQIGPVLDRLDTLLAATPKEATARVLAEVNAGLSGSSADVGALVDSSRRLVGEAQAEIEATRGLVDALDPVLTTQQQLSGTTQAYASALAGLTSSVAQADPDVRSLLRTGPGALRRTDRLASGLQASLPVLLANLTTDAEVARVYLPNIEQSLVTYPALMARLQNVLNQRAAEGDARLDLRAAFDDPPSCIAGYLPPDRRRSPTVSTVRDAGTAYCHLPADAPEGVRGARNYPCPDSSARAATPALCGLRFGSAATAPVRVATYDARSGRFYAPDGAPLRTVAPTRGDAGWQSLLLSPLGLR